MKPRAASKRSDLIKVTKDLLWERGYEATSPRDIMERSGAGQGSLYHHFPGKLALSIAALDEMADEEAAKVSALFTADKPPLQRITDYLRRERFALRGCRLARVSNETSMESAEFRAPVARYLQAVEGFIAQALREARDQGAWTSALTPEAMAAMLLAIVEGGFVMARAYWDEERMSKVLDAACALLEKPQT